MYSLVVTHLARSKPLVYQLDPKLNVEGAKIKAKHLAQYTAMQLMALSQKPEVWRIDLTGQTRFEVIVDGDVLVTIELARKGEYPDALMADCADVLNRITVNERASNS